MLARFMVWVLMAVACSMFIKLMLILDFNKQQYAHVPGQCRNIQNIKHGAEDMHLLDDGTILVTSGLKFIDISGREDVRGRVFMLNLKDTSEMKRYIADELKIESETMNWRHFNPHGISSFTSKSRVNVYIASHGPEGDTVESFIFNKQKKSLKHTKSIKDPSIRSINNLVAVGPDKFFFTNDGYFRNKWFRLFENLLMCNLGNVIYFDGKAKVVDSGLHFPNGIALSKDNKHMYVALSGSEIVRVYNVSRDMSVIQNADMGLLTSPDNIFVDPDTGDLWIGCHPVFHTILHHLWSPDSVSSPSQVLHVRVQGDSHDRWVLTEAYGDGGNLLSGSSSAIFSKDQLFIGSIHHNLMHCDVTQPEIL